MIFLIISIVIPVLTVLFVPLLIESKNKKDDTRWLLYIAAACFFISWYLPSPDVFGQQTAATTHFLGGGVYTALLWVYVIRRLEWRKPWYIEIASLYALVSMLGVANEIFELVVVKLGLAGLSLTDTSIDLLVNTVGAGFGYILYKTIRLNSKWVEK